MEDHGLRGIGSARGLRLRPARGGSLALGGHVE